MKRRAGDGAVGREAPWTDEGAEARALLELARRAEPSAPVSEDASARSFLLFVRRRAEAERRGSAWAARGGWRYGLGLAAALVLAVVAFELGDSWRSGQALSYHLKSGAPVGQAIDARQGPVELDFSDGTVVRVDYGTEARVAETTRRGARFRLDSGRMTFDVVPHAERGNWSVDAGPFQVRVTGTVFTVEWSASEGTLRVEVTRGHVVVEGAGQRRELGPGDSFEHRSSAATSGEETAAVDPAPSPVKTELGSASPVPSVTPPRPTEKASGWSQLVAAGEFAAVIDAAARRGIQSCLDGCTREDLRALADAARLGGKAGLAERALLAQRARFPGSSDAAAAAFLLGRAAEGRRDPRAIAWYDRYLAESPRGRFASDALGRKMMFVAQGDQKSAALLAEQYLSRFPDGPYAGHAHGLLEATKRGR